MAWLCLVVLLLVSLSTTRSDVTVDDELKAINSLLTSADWVTLEALSRLGIQYQKTEGRELINHHYYLGVALYEQGRVKEAAENFEQAVEATPQSADIWGALGEACLTSWDISQAIKAYSRAAALSSSSTYYSAKLAKARSWVCSWQDYEAENERIAREVEEAVAKDDMEKLGNLKLADLGEEVRKREKDDMCKDRKAGGGSERSEATS